MNNEALIAAKTGDVEQLKKFLNQGIDVNARDENGRTLLHHAANNDKHKVIQCLLQNEADILITTDKNNTALHIAIIKSNNAVVNAILENVSRNKLRKLLDAKTKATRTAALHVAAKNDGYEDVSVLLKYGANFEITNDAGEKPVDVTKDDRLKGLFELIDKSFAKAKISDKDELADDLDKCNLQDFTSVMNCRNNHGHTIMQVLVLNEHYRLANNLLYSRILQATNREQEPMQDPKRIDEVNKLAKNCREFREFWETQREKMQELMKTLGNVMITMRACKLGCQVLEKAHEVLLAYREFEGKEKSLTIDPTMKTLEEAIEALGFDPEELFVVADEEACYYEKLPEHLQTDVESFVILLEGLIDATFDFLLGYIYGILSFAAVKNNDIDKVEQLVNMKVINNGIDSNRMTPLCYAAQNGNEKIIEMLLTTTAKTVRKNALSPVYLAASKGHAKVVKILMKNVTERELTEFIDCRMDTHDNWTALHVAANIGNLEIVKTLLRYGASYRILDSQKRTPLDLTTNQEVCDFFKLVDKSFQDAKDAKDELISKLETMSKVDFRAVINTRNREGKTLAEVATKSKAEKIVDFIVRRNDEIVGKKKWTLYKKIG